MNYDPNVVSVTITAGGKPWFAIGAHMSPNDQLMLHQVEDDLAHCLAGTDALLIGNLNSCLEQPCKHSKEDMATVISNHVLE